MPTVNFRTGPGRPKRAARTVLEHTISIQKKEAVHADLEELTALWPRLPEDVKAGFLTVARSVTGAGR
jgi:hypothetical protein